MSHTTIEKDFYILLLIWFLMTSINLHMDAMKAWPDKANAYFKGLPSTIRDSPADEQLAYASVFAGMVLVIIGFLLLLII